MSIFDCLITCCDAGSFNVIVSNEPGSVGVNLSCVLNFMLVRSVSPRYLCDGVLAIHCEWIKEIYT